MALPKVDQQLITRWVEPHPWRGDVAEARLKGSKISVWAIVGHLRTVRGDVDAVASDYQLPREAVEAAIAYYHEHQAAIDARLAANVRRPPQP